MLTQVLKMLFDYARGTQPIKLGPLRELAVDGFDAETIWEQLQLRNPAVRHFVSKVTRKLLEKGEELVLCEEEEEEVEEAEHEEAEEEEAEDDGEEERFEEDEVVVEEEEEEEEEGGEEEEMSPLNLPEGDSEGEEKEEEEEEE